MMNWREYQEQAASFFRQLGLKANIEHPLKGARGVHKIDVFVSGELYGIEFSWVVECKAWKQNIPKEKVLALQSIVQDVGADRGYLLSEKGFQSGAIQVSRNSNIILTSIDHLSEITKEARFQTIAENRSFEIKKSMERLTEFKRRSEKAAYNPIRLELRGDLGVCELLLDDALKGNFPVEYPMKKVEFETFHEVVSYIDQCIAKANKWVPDES
jgi:hypothetical protein